MLEKLLKIVGKRVTVFHNHGRIRGTLVLEDQPNHFLVMIDGTGFGEFSFVPFFETGVAEIENPDYNDYRIYLK